ncbi:MAG: glycoside hydrolase family 2 protein [Treponema sp.]|nr:glycoside hydrolase family 2 protein [Treponema sp.]
MNILDLSGDWNLSGKDVNCIATIPGDFHSALLKNGIIKDPFYGFNEQEQFWVGKTDWTIERTFDFEKKENSYNFLTITEADTFFTVFVNGKHAGKGQNQFIRHRFEISKFLKNGKNTIKILFESAEKCCEKIAKKLPYPIPHAQYDISSQYRNLARKCQCHGGWDWGPCIMVSGIYDKIFIETVSEGLFDNILVNYNHKNEDWTANITATLTSFTEKKLPLTFKISGDGIETSTETIKADLVKGKNQVTAKIKVHNPKTWKTSGELREEDLTENTLYNLEVSFKDSVAGTVKEEKKICFSTLKCVSEYDKVKNEPGRSLYFEKNGRKVFAKGSNRIPPDSLPSRLTEERYTDLLKSAVEANQNIIRVWGGGIYEKDIFYELCDRLGIIIWHDFMFACSTYPNAPWFQDEVSKEINYQVARLQHHPSIGIWCGNNENFGSLNWFKECRDNPIRYMVDYDRLFNGIIKPIVNEIDPNRMFWPSSPCAGPDDFKDNWHADSFGDMHYWSVWHERKSFDAYMSINPRFVSEFGYEAFPSIDCIRSFAEEKDFNFTSKLMEYHQRCTSGNSIMLENFTRYFRFPETFENMVYLSQVQQAVAIKTAVDWWRSLKPHCMGSIVWQLNDIWPCPSWSSLEYSGKWKLLHYEEKKFFSNVYVPAFIKDNTLHCSFCNDTKETVKAEIKIRFIKFDGSEYAPTVTKVLSVNADETAEFYTQEIKSEDKETYFIYVQMIGISESKKLYNCENTVWPALYKHCDLEEAQIKMEVSEINGGYQITLEADKPSFFVSLDTNTVKGRFSDNMFTLLPGSSVTVDFTPSDKTTAEDLMNDIVINDLRHTY